MLETLNYLHRIATTEPAEPKPRHESELSKAAALIERDQLIHRIAHSDDEICQVMLFRWLLEQGLEDQVLNEPNKTLEYFIYT